MDIDIVIAWVDGSDPDWLREKARFRAPEEDGEGRYRDLGLLPYWFRLVEQNAPWARKIHFVTWGHVPEFLNLESEKIHIVRHMDFIPEEFLPTFSSHAIELNLHRIPGLAEHFIYFNDDMFLLRPSRPEDFFRDGLPCTWGAEVPWVFSGEPGVWSHAAANGLGVINRRFPKKEAVLRHGGKYRRGRWQDVLRTAALEVLFPDGFLGFANLHSPNSYRKQTFREVWAAEPELLGRTCRRRFRGCEDVNQWLMLWWQVAGGAFYPRQVDNLVLDVSPENIGALCAAVRQKKHTFLCANDPGGDIEQEAAGLRAAFQEIVPEKSGFER